MVHVAILLGTGCLFRLNQSRKPSDHWSFLPTLPMMVMSMHWKIFRSRTNKMLTFPKSRRMWSQMRLRSSRNVVTNTSVEVKLDNVAVPNMSGMTMPSMSSDALASAVMSATNGAGQISKALNSRSKAAKRELLNKYGGNEDTERSVSMALKWLAAHQRADGAWTFAHSTVCNGGCKEMGSATDATNAATGIA